MTRVHTFFSLLCNSPTFIWMRNHNRFFIPLNEHDGGPLSSPSDSIMNLSSTSLWFYSPLLVPWSWKMLILLETTFNMLVRTLCILTRSYKFPLLHVYRNVYGKVVHFLKFMFLVGLWSMEDYKKEELCENIDVLYVVEWKNKLK